MSTIVEEAESGVEMKRSLDPRSEFERMFGVRYRGSGRPAGNPDPQPVFPACGAPGLLVAQAARRAYAVVHEEQRDRLRRVYLQELEVLRDRGVEQVAADSGVTEWEMEDA